MAEFFETLIPFALGIVFLILLAGIFVMFRGGRLNQSWSNRLMRWRVIAQFVAICIVMAALYFAGRG
ncbi:MAG TPA: twin transmembrane helix small protein [Alphaproteobacteria bacterium]|nr:twin transmembrane helix small protein [Alphaproteobacteria bacterium]HAM48536.1 twin transmembrane helix small protein [Alphaproteobacteria bacterium]HBA42151.1 twin transmembrane helix small protein [Alphaproteobacteria bacterium]HBC54727.1 twin transmembrane helix small protein [Alphaproteobacteria bacterium]HBF97072.1 twin transmembrane helix small protein [Alphaproteobacteria bacterium]